MTRKTLNNACTTYFLSALHVMHEVKTMNFDEYSIFCGWCKQPLSVKCSCEKIMGVLIQHHDVSLTSYQYRLQPYDLMARIVIYKNELKVFSLSAVNHVIIDTTFNPGFVLS